MLIVDAVQSSRHLTQRKSDALVRSIKRLAPKRERDLLDRHLSVSGTPWFTMISTGVST